MAQTKKAHTPTTARKALTDACIAQTRQSGIARVLQVEAKTLRGRTRAGRIPDPANEGAFLPPLHVSESGETSLTDAYKGAIAAYYLSRMSDDALVNVAAALK